MTSMAHTPATAQDVAFHYGHHKARGKKDGRDVFHVPCPAHAGEDPNLHIWDDGEGNIGARCHSHQCEWRDIMDAFERDGVPVARSSKEREREDRKVVRAAERAVARDQIENMEVIEAAEFEWLLSHYLDPMQDLSTYFGVRLLRKFPEMLLVAQNDKKDARLFAFQTDSGIWMENSETLQRLMLESTEDYAKHIQRAKATGRLDFSTATRIWRSVLKANEPAGRRNLVLSLPGAIATMRKERTLRPDLTMCHEKKLDSNRRYLGAPNGVIDLNTGKLLDPVDGRKHLVTRMLPDEYDPTARHPAVDKLFAHPMVSETVRDYVLAAFGYALRGTPWSAKSLYCFYDDSGNGDSGKSTLFKAVADSLGSYAGEFQRDALQGIQKNDAGRATPEREPFVTYRMTYCEEVAKVNADSAVVKMLVGSPTCSYRMLRQNPQSLPITATAFVNLNGVPDFDLLDGAMHNRYRPIHFPTIPKAQQDATIQDLLNAPDSEGTRKFRQAIVAKLVAAAVANPEPPFAPPEVEADRERHYQQKLGREGQFIQTAVVRTDDPADIVSTTALWDAWVVRGELTEAEQTTKARRAFSTLATKLIGASSRRIRTPHGLVYGWRHRRLVTPDEAGNGIDVADEELEEMAELFEAEFDHRRDG